MPRERRGRDKETRRGGDKETRRSLPLVSSSPCLLLSLSLLLCVSVANSSAQTAIKDPAARVTEALAAALRQATDILTIEDPAARDEALRKLLETGDASEQIQAAREAVITRWAQQA